MTGVAMPLFADEFHLTAAQHGIIGAASLFGILVGAIGLGGLSDYFGRKVMFVAEMIIFMVFLILLVVSPSYPWLVVFLFAIGVALGCDYPTAHLIISESTPSSVRGRLVLGAFGFQALDALTGTAVGYLALKNIPQVGAWRWMYGIAIIPALMVAVGRFYISESAPWLFSRGRIEEAEQQAAQLLRRTPLYPKQLNSQAAGNREGQPAASNTAVAMRCYYQGQSARDNPGVSSLVPAGSGHVWYRHFYANDHGGVDRP
jgi:MFS family permease